MLCEFYMIAYVCVASGSDLVFGLHSRGVPFYFVDSRSRRGVPFCYLDGQEHGGSSVLLTMVVNRIRSYFSFLTAGLEGPFGFLDAGDGGPFSGVGLYGRLLLKPFCVKVNLSKMLAHQNE